MRLGDICHCCHVRLISRPRGLCWRCFYTPGVRDRFPSKSKYARRGVGNGNGNGKLPPFPTHATPGSDEKIAVLEERARMKVLLWHPEDVDFFKE